MSFNDPLSPIRMQLMWDRLIAVVEEQALALMRTGFSTSTREAGDLSAGVFDLKGDMLAQAVTGTPGHVNSMARSVIHFIREFPVETMKPGDAYVTNDPWKGTGHLYDIVVTSPAFHDGKLVAQWTATTQELTAWRSFGTVEIHERVHAATRSQGAHGQRRCGGRHACGCQRCCTRRRAHGARLLGGAHRGGVRR